MQLLLIKDAGSVLSQDEEIMFEQYQVVLEFS